MNDCIVLLLPACICFVNSLFSFCLPTDILILCNPTPLFVESWRSNAMYFCFYKVFASGKDINSFALFHFPYIYILLSVKEFSFEKDVCFKFNMDVFM